MLKLQIILPALYYKIIAIEYPGQLKLIQANFILWMNMNFLEVMAILHLKCLKLYLNK